MTSPRWSCVFSLKNTTANSEQLRCFRYCNWIERWRAAANKPLFFYNSNPSPDPPSQKGGVMHEIRKEHLMRPIFDPLTFTHANEQKSSPFCFFLGRGWVKVWQNQIFREYFNKVQYVTRAITISFQMLFHRHTISSTFCVSTSSSVNSERFSKKFLRNYEKTEKTAGNLVQFWNIFKEISENFETTFEKTEIRIFGDSSIRFGKITEK